MKQSAMKPISAAKKMLLLGGYFASIRDKAGQRRYMEKLSIIGGFDFVSGWVREVFVRKVNDKRVVIVKVSHA